MIYRVYQCGILILLVTSLPVTLDHGAGLPGLIVAMALIGLGVAGLKATLPPFLGMRALDLVILKLLMCLAVDQYSRTEPRLLKTNGQEVFESDRTLTIQFITNLFFWYVNRLFIYPHAMLINSNRLVNVASLSSLASTWIELKVDFWVSYLVAFAFLLLTQILIFIWRNRFSE